MFVMLRGTPGAAAPPGFLPKRGFQLKLRRALHVRCMLLRGMLSFLSPCELPLWHVACNAGKQSCFYGILHLKFQELESCS